MLAWFQQDDECLPWHCGGRVRAGGLACGRAIRRSECHLILGGFVQGHRDEPRLGGHWPFSPEDLYRPPDLVSVQGIERMAAPGGLVTASGSRDAVILVSFVLTRYHWRSLPQAGAASAGGQFSFTMTCPACVVPQWLTGEIRGDFIPAFGAPKDLSEFVDCVFDQRQAELARQARTFTSEPKWTVIGCGRCFFRYGQPCFVLKCG